jgi:hypothetical protein
MTRRAAFSLAKPLLAIALLAWSADVQVVAAQDRFLGKQEIVLLGFGLRVEPDRQVVPKDIATIVSTFLQAPGTPPGDVPPFAPDAVVRATLRGPGAGSGIELTAAANTPFNIPPLGIAGIHTLEDIRLESGGEVLMRGTPESVTIEVIDKLLVTQVTARALSAQEIREKGIVFDKSSFQAYNFTAAFALQETPIHVSFPVVLPSLQGAQDVTVGQAGLGAILAPTLPQLKTIIPDTLRLQTQIPNLQVVGFTLSLPQLQGKNLVVPPIPGIVVIPGDIGFLDQFFSVMLLVGNVAPAGSNLVVSELTGSILLPPGNDTVVGSGDDPLRMAQTTNGESRRVQLVVQPGLDAKLGTADDIATLGPGESGSAEYLVEGRREGTHVIEFSIAGTLHGLPGGPVQVTGRAVGSVLVRNPTFTLTFTHPDTVAAGEAYTLDVTVTNTSPSPANFVSVNLFAQHVVGATIVGSPSRQIDSIAADDSATVSFDLVARVSGKVTAATLDADDQVQGRFSLKSSVGELGVPVSPDSLVLPSQAKALPAEVRNAALGLLGKAWAVATAPAAALPQNVRRFSKQIVYDRAVQVAEAGFRVALEEPVPQSVAQLEMEFIGSDAGRLAARYPDPGDLAFAQSDFIGFDELRRGSVRGDVWASAVAAVLAPDLAAKGVAGFHRSFAEQMTYRPPQLSVVIGNAGGPLPVTIRLIDAQGRRIGGVNSQGKILKEIPYGDLMNFTNGIEITGQMIVLAAPGSGPYHVQFEPVAGVPPGTPFDVSLVVPDASGHERHLVYQAITGGATVIAPYSPSDPYAVLLDLPVAGAAPSGTVAPTSDAAIVPPAPRIISAIQQANADLISCDITTAGVGVDANGAHLGLQAGRVIAVLFSEEVTPASVQDRLAASDITNYLVDENAVVGVALQPGGRIAFLALRDPIGTFIPRQITIAGVTGLGGGVLAAQTVPIEATTTDAAAVVTGQVLNADGTPVPFANVRLLINPCGTSSDGLEGISSKSADAQGRFAWDYVVQGGMARIVAVDPATDDSRTVDFTSQRDGQRLNVNIVFLGRGTLTGRTLAENGSPIAGAQLRVTSLTDHSQYAATSDADGRFTIARIPVGTLFIEAVNVKVDLQGVVVANAKGTASELIPLAGATTIRDVTLFDFIAPTVVVKYGTLTGHVLRGDGASPVADSPVVAYYQSGSQPGVACPAGGECAIAVERTDASGGFTMTKLTAGHYRLVTFDEPTFQQGEARVAVPADGTASVNVLLSQGLGTVQGVVMEANGTPVPNARVGGGLSLTTTNAAGQFTLSDVPIGRREIVAVSDTLGTKGSAFIDLVQAGQTVNASIVLEATASIAGTVFQANGTTPVPNNKVYLFHRSPGGIQIVATATTDAAGHYLMEKLALRSDYTLSSFRPDFGDGNVKLVVLKFANQVLRGDIVFRGGSGHVVGTVFDADGTTPLRAAVGISGDQVVVAGGLVGAGFQTVTNYAVSETNITTGAYHFDGVLVGPFTLSAAGQFSPDPISFDSTIPSPGATVRVDLRLQPTSKIAGTVFRPDGVTPVGRDVIVRYKSSASKVVCADTSAITVGTETVAPGECKDIPQGVQEETVVTDDAGRYLLPLVNAGPFTLTADDLSTGRTAQVAGNVKPGQTGEFSIRLLGISTLTINVRGSDATTPIPGARVEVSQIGFPKKSIVSLADGSGTLVLNGGDAFSEGEFVVMATDVRNGFAGRASGRVTTDNGHVTLNVYLYNQSGTVFGTVFRPDGLTPVPNAEVVIRNNGGPLAFAVTDGAGVYRQDLIPLGDFRVDVFEAATARYGFAAGRIDLDRQQVPVNVIEASRGLVTGTAVDSSNLAPIKNAEVRLDQTGPGGRPLAPLYTTSGVDGTFSFPGATVGPFTIVASKTAFLPDDPYGIGSAAAALAFEGERVDVPVLVHVIRREFGRIEGSVINADGTPAANVSLDVCPSNCVSTQNHLGATTAADGSFAVDRVLVGRFLIRAQSQVTPNAAQGYGELLFEGDITRTTLTLTGVGQVSGTVEFADGRLGANVSVSLFGQPSSGCTTGACTIFTDGSGHFEFINVPARTFTVTAVDPVGGLRGAAAGALNPGGHEVIRVVLEPTASVTGRVLFSNQSPAAGITVDLVSTTSTGPRHFFAVTDQAGQFALPVLPIATYAASFEDPLGTGIAQRTVVAVGPIALGDIVLDDAPPAVVSVTPAESSSGVARNSAVQIVFSEPVSATTVSHANISVTGPAGPVTGTLQLSNGDKTVTFTPLALLAEQTRYAVTARNITDLLGKPMTVGFTSIFTTVDLTPPAAIDLSPAANANGVPVASTIRVKFSEPFDPAQFHGPPIVVRQGATALGGRTDYILGNTTIVFTPLVPLNDDIQYAVQTLPAVDLSGNAQPQGLTYTFSTTDRSAPVIRALVAAGSGGVIENGTTQVIADVGTSADIAVVDFFINDQPALAARTSPFALSLQATPALGQPGAQIKISALATDTSGNRSTSPVVVFIPITADQPATLSITAPADGVSARNGERITVGVHATDDLGITQVGYRAQTGQPQDAASRPISPVVLDRVETFAFTVPTNAVPGSTILVEASAVDTKGHVTSAAPIHVLVLDATLPSVTITGTTTGARVAPGQQTSAVVSAQDLGGIASITFTTGGVFTSTQTRSVSPAQNAVATAFPFTVPATAHAGDVLTLDATATDAAGNTATAARVLLPIADLAGPTITLRTASGSLEIVPGTVVSVIAQSEDDTAVASVAITGQGAFNVSDAKPVSPPSNSVQTSFTISVPAQAVIGSVLALSATAADVFGNVSAPATLSLTVKGVVDVTLPPSLLLSAGETAPIVVQLSGPAPAGGVRVDLASADAAIAQVTTTVQFAAGETSKMATVSAATGGVVSVTASIGGVPRASMTVTVRGGIVTGTVLNPQLQPVTGAEIVVQSAGLVSTTTTDGAGAFLLAGVGGGFGTTFTVKAHDPATALIGATSGAFNARNGFGHVTVLLLSAGTIGGTVLRADGQTAAGAGARVDIFAAGDLSTVVGSTFTDANGVYEFPLVSIGNYTIEASDTAGNRGRSSSVSLTTSGQHLDVPVSYLGRGVVTGRVLDGLNNPQPNVPLTFTASSLFGPAPSVTTNTAGDGTFRFNDVFVGTFTVQAHDPITDRVGAASGTIVQHQQTVAVDVTLGTWGGVEGTVVRADGATPAPNADVRLSLSAGVSSGTFLTKTDAQGHYSFMFLPLGSYVMTVEEPGTRGLGRATGTLSVHAQILTQNITLFGQGSVVVTVVDANGALMPGAHVFVSSNNGQVSDTLNGTTANDGTVLIEHVLAGNITVSANRDGRSGTQTGTLTAGDIKPITVTLQSTASIAGAVVLADGQTPAAGSVAICDTCPKTSLAADGTYRLDNLLLSTYNLFAYDLQGRKRAVFNNVRLDANGQVAVANMTFVGLGTVTGRVLNPDNSSAPNLTVTVRSLDPVFGGYLTPRTDAAGFYSVDRVVVGNLIVSAGNASQGLLGEANGALAGDGATVNIDVLLKNNAINLPTSRSDGNFFNWDIARDAVSTVGHNFVFGPLFNGGPLGGLHLEIISAGTSNGFTGASIGTTEAGGREVAVTQTGLAGLNVTRKVFVSPAYFARYLELLTNPSANPITVDVRVKSITRAGSIDTTSSGDQLLNTTDPLNPDRWLTAAVGQDIDPFSTSNQNVRPQLGFVFDGSGAVQRAADAAFGLNSLGQGEVSYTWSSVTIEPGATVAFMHFAVQQYGLAPARASVMRLAQLPPEAIDSLSPSEIAEIRNFAVPVDGTSLVAPLPPLDGSISGTVFEADGVTPVPSQVGSGFQLNLILRSNHILFGRTYTSATDANGHFSFGQSGNLFLGPVTIPIGPFTLLSTHRWTTVAAPPTIGDFLPGSTNAIADVIYSNTAIVKGFVRRHTGALVPGAVITSSGPSFVGTYPNGNLDGSFAAGGLPPGAATVTAKMLHPQRTGTVYLTGALSLTAVAGQTQTQDITLQPTGALTGTVRNAAGALAVNIAVDLMVDTANTVNRLRAFTDSAGVYRINDAPTGTFTVQTTDPVSQLTKTASATIVTNVTTTVDMTFVAVGSVQVTAKFTNGQPAVNAPIQIQKTSISPTFTAAGNTDANGRLTIPNVPNNFVVRVFRPSGSSTFTTVDIPGMVTAQGEVVPIAATVVPIGTVQVQVRTVGGAPVPNARVDSDAKSQSFQAFNADATGTLTQTSVAGNRVFRVRAYDAAQTEFREVTGQVTSEAQTLTLTVTVGGVGSLSGHVFNADGTPAGGQVVKVIGGNYFASNVTTDQTGAYSLNGLATGSFRAVVADVVHHVGGSALGRIDQAGDAAVADISLTDTTLPATTADANGYAYRINTGGWLGQGGSGSNAEGYITAYGVIAGPAASGLNTNFGGDATAAATLDGRQLTIRDFQTGNAAVLQPILATPVTVTRNVYVPESGYFARFLEILDNPSPNAVLINIQVSGKLTSTRIVATSSGDATMQTSDLWMVTDRPALTTTPAVAHVYGSSGARVVPSIASRTIDSSSRITPTLEWRNILVPANGRAIVMHFSSQEANAAAAQTAAERLVQLPPEALVGLSAADASAIVNFVVPTDLSSGVAPFASLSGRVFASNGVTPMKAQVRVTGNSSPIFASTVTVPTNAAGQYVARTLVPGPVTAQAIDPVSGLSSAVAALTLQSGETSVTQDLLFAASGLLTGTVRLPAGAAAGAAVVTVTGGASAVTPPVDSSGRYLVAMPPGTYTVTATLTGRFPTTLPAVVVTADQTTTADLRFKALATLVVAARRADGTAISGARVYVTDSVLVHPAVFTSNSGLGVVAVVSSVVEGSYTVRVMAPDDLAPIGNAAGSIAQADDGQSFQVGVQSTAGSVNGTVFAADGQSAVPGATVKLLDAESNTLIASAATDAAGHYDLPSVTVPGTSGFRIEGRSSLNPNVSGQAAGAVAAGQTVVVDVTVPIAVVRGAVTYADGTAPPFAFMSVTQEDANGNLVPQALFAVGGRYSVIGLKAGAFEVVATDAFSGEPGVEGTARGSLATDSSVATADVAMQAFGTVAGTVSDAAGNPIDFADLALSSSGSPMFRDFYDSSDDEGAFSFEHVAAGRVTVQACRYSVNDTYQCGSGTGTIGYNGESITVNVVLRDVGGAVAGRLFAADGVSPIDEEEVLLRSGEDGPLNSGGMDYTYTDDDGFFTFLGVPRGPVTVSLGQPAASASGDNTAGPVTLALVVGNAVGCAQTLTGADGFKYDVNCAGELRTGGTVDGRLKQAYAGRAYNLRINGITTGDLGTASLEQGGRQLVYGPMQLSGVVATRRVFVPAAGGFARYLETITNRGAQPVTIEVQIDAALSGAVHLTVDPAVTNNTYAVTLATPSTVPGGVVRPALAHVFGGPAAPVPVSAVHVQGLTGTSSYKWTLTIAAGQSVTLMHFAVQRDATDTAGAASQAQALVSLTDANALAGMTPADKARVVNFVIP